MTAIRPIPSLNGLYGAGDDGRIYRITVSPPRPLIPSFAGASVRYQYVQPSIGGVPRSVAVHRLVCEAFYGPQPDWAHEVRHLDGNHLNNRPENLDWGTRSQNRQDTVGQGRHGSYRTRKLTPEQVEYIRTTTESSGTVARRFAVSKSLVLLIRRRLRHVDPSPPPPANFPRHGVK